MKTPVLEMGEEFLMIFHKKTGIGKIFY